MFAQVEKDNGRMIKTCDEVSHQWEFDDAMKLDLIRSVRKDMREKLYKTNYPKSTTK